MKNQNVSDVKANEATHLNSKGEEIKPGDLISYKKGENNYIRGVIEELVVENDRPKAVVKQLQKEGYGNLHSFDISDKNLHIMTRGQKYDIRELQDHFKNGVYGKNFNEVIKQEGVLYALTRGYRSPVIKNFQTTKKDENGVKSHHSFDAKIKVYGPTGNLSVKCDIVKQELKERPEIFGKEFTPQMWETLKNEGHLGLVEGFVNSKTGEIFNAYVSLDKEINDVVMINEKAIDIKKLYKTNLSQKQQSDLKAGKEIVVNVDLGPKGKESMKLRVDATKEKLTRTDKVVKQSKDKTASKAASVKNTAKAQESEKKSKGVKM